MELYRIDNRLLLDQHCQLSSVVGHQVNPARHVVQHLINLIGGATGQQTATIDQQEIVSNRLHLMQDVAGHQHALALFDPVAK